MRTFFKKLAKIAERVEHERDLEFFAAVHPIDGLYDRWDLLISSPNLEPWSTAAIRYVTRLLQESLSIEDLVRISQIVILPADNPIVQTIEADDSLEPGRLTSTRSGDFDQVFLARRNGIGANPVMGSR